MGVDSRHEPSAHQAFKLFIEMRCRRAPALPLARGGLAAQPATLSGRACVRRAPPALIPYQFAEITVLLLIGCGGLVL